jgi:hypothetical protein
LFCFFLREFHALPTVHICRTFLWKAT